MTDFDYDVKQKKDIARSAGKKISGAKSRRCSLPHDGLNSKQLEALNGPVKSYNLSKPMTWAELKAMPAELQKEYLRKLGVRFSPSSYALAEMLGTTHTTVGRLLRDLGLSRPKGHRMTEGDKKAWEFFLADVEAPVAEEQAPEIEKPEAEERAPEIEKPQPAPEPEPEEPAPEPEPELPVIPTEPDLRAAIVSGKVVAEGAMDYCLHLISTQLGNLPGNVRVSVKYEVID